jgi:1,4-alpha-glucan branching enzyme
MVDLARRFGEPKTELEQRALRQAARELLLLQSSDWPFIMSTGTTVPYATRRFNEHVIQFTQLFDDLNAGKLDPNIVADLESRDNLFPDVDYRLYAM